MKYIYVIMLAASIMGSCRPGTEVISTWKNPAVTPGYDRVLVTALSNDTESKKSMERNLKRALRKQKVHVYRDVDVFPITYEASDANKEYILNNIRGKRANAIVTISYLDTKADNHYVSRNNAYQPINQSTYYGRFWEYYTYWYPVVYSPQYYTDRKTYFLESNVYDADTEELIWSAQSEGYKPKNLNKASKRFTKIIAKKLSQDRVIK